MEVAIPKAGCAGVDVLQQVVVESSKRGGINIRWIMNGWR